MGLPRRSGPFGSAFDLASASPGSTVGVADGGSACVITDNWIDPPSAGITLGSATSHCLVAHNHGATIVDDGTGNHVVP